MILPCRKYVSMHRQMFSQKILTYATVPLKQLYLIHTVVQCTPQVFGVIKKNRV